MSLSKSFPPLFKADARVLVLGSMPGVASLNAQQYYAHPRNVFWRFVAESFGEPLPEVYERKIEMLYRHKLALWDVLQSCYREGSLDASIDSATESANEFNLLFKKLPHLRCIVFNGKKAEQSFRKHVLNVQVGVPDGVALVGLPSTSPANASISYQQKLDAWKHIFNMYALD